MGLLEPKKKLLIKLAEMNRYLEELEEMFPDEDAYLDNLALRRACEKTIELAIESVLDIVALIVVEEKLGFPEGEDSLIKLLKDKKIITEKLAAILMEMKGFRNILVHRYGNINNELVYTFLSEELNDFNEFEKQIRNWLKAKK